MAGHERRRKVRSLLLAEAVREIGPDATALDYVCHRVENGATLREIATEVTAVLDFTVRSSLVRAAAAEGHDDRAVSDRLTASRARGAEELVAEGKELIDNVAPDRDAIAKVKAQSDVRQFIASRWNRAEYGEQRAPNVSVSIGSLHIEALRARKARARIVASEQVTDVMEQVSEQVTDVMPLLEGEVLPG